MPSAPPAFGHTMSHLIDCRVAGDARLASDEADLSRRVFWHRHIPQRQSSANKTCSGIKVIKRVTDVRASDR